MNSFTTINPATGENLKTYSYTTWSEAQEQILVAHRDFQKWRKLPFERRSQVLSRAAEGLRSHQAELAKLMHQEMGKHIDEGKAEVEKCAATCEYYAKEAAGMLKNQEAASSPYMSAEVSFQPLGVIFSVMPWNFPLWQVIRFAAPSLMAGNVILLKHADITAGTGEMIAKIFNEAAPDFKLVQNCHVTHDDAEQVIGHPQVRGVTFTGSTKAGKSIAATSAKSLKKTVLELGGSDAYIILADADIQQAAKLCAKTRLQNCGQSCVAGKRFIVENKVAQEFIQSFANEMKQIEVGPLANKKFQVQLIEQVEKLKKWGGQVVLGGTAPGGAGAFYPASLIVFEKNNPEINSEEIFGPVATVIIATDADDAMAIANSSPYGLGGGIFTKDVKRGKAMIEKDMEAGFVVVNDFVKSDPRIPFGGVKDSGYGRELGHFGIMEFVNIKTVAVGGPQ